MLGLRTQILDSPFPRGHLCHLPGEWPNCQAHSKPGLREPYPLLFKLGCCTATSPGFLGPKEDTSGSLTSKPSSAGHPLEGMILGYSPYSQHRLHILSNGHSVQNVYAVPVAGTRAKLSSAFSNSWLTHLQFQGHSYPHSFYRELRCIGAGLQWKCTMSDSKSLKHGVLHCAHYLLHWKTESYSCTLLCYGYLT